MPSSLDEWCSLLSDADTCRTTLQPIDGDLGASIVWARDSRWLDRRALRSSSTASHNDNKTMTMISLATIPPPYLGHHTPTHVVDRLCLILRFCERRWKLFFFLFDQPREGYSTSTMQPHFQWLIADNHKENHQQHHHSLWESIVILVVVVVASSYCCWWWTTIYRGGYLRTEQVGGLDLSIAGAVRRYPHTVSLSLSLSLSLAPEYISLFQRERERYLPSNASHSCRERLIQGTQKFDHHHILEQSSPMWVLNGLEASELIWWMVLMFLVAAIWSSSGAASYRAP